MTPVTLAQFSATAGYAWKRLVTTGDQSGITMSARQVDGQIGIADWLAAKGPYHEWKVQGYKRVLGR